jgi:hypothetical protein
MAEIERLREALTAPPGPEYWQRKAEAGWTLAAIEWTRPAPGEGERRLEPVPFGLRVAADCNHLEEHPREMEALRRMLALIADDLSLSQVADELNRQGFRDRVGTPWTQVGAFNMLPRLIEVAPQIRARWGAEHAAVAAAVPG